MQMLQIENINKIGLTKLTLNLKGKCDSSSDYQAFQENLELLTCLDVKTIEADITGFTSISDKNCVDFFKYCKQRNLFFTFKGKTNSATMKKLKIFEKNSENFFDLSIPDRNCSLHTLRINICKVDENSKLPVFSRQGDACMDCFAREDVIILENSHKLIPLGFKIALPRNWEALIRPCSGLALKQGVTVLNSPGTIDENYREEVGAILYNTQSSSIKFERGDRVCQLAIRPCYTLGVEAIEWNELEQLDSTTRGEAGFGSSGK